MGFAQNWQESPDFLEFRGHRSGKSAYGICRLEPRPSRACFRRDELILEPAGTAPAPTEDSHHARRTTKTPLFLESDQTPMVCRPPSTSVRPSLFWLVVPRFSAPSGGLMATVQESEAIVRRGYPRRRSKICRTPTRRQKPVSTAKFAAAAFATL